MVPARGRRGWGDCGGPFSFTHSLPRLDVVNLRGARRCRLSLTDAARGATSRRRRHGEAAEDRAPGGGAGRSTRGRRPARGDGGRSGRAGRAGPAGVRARRRGPGGLGAVRSRRAGARGRQSHRGAEGAGGVDRRSASRRDARAARSRRRRRGATLAASADSGQVDEAAATEVGTATAALALAEARLRAEVLQVLTPEQRAGCQKRAAERAERFAEAGRAPQVAASNRADGRPGRLNPASSRIFVRSAHRRGPCAARNLPHTLDAQFSSPQVCR